MPKNTTITIAAKIENQNSDKKQLIISLQDQGIGMTKAQIQMALDGKGTQIDKSALKNKLENHHCKTHHHEQTHSHNQTQTQIDSHGIGMPLVKKLVELQNGEIKILSKIRSGTEIILCFNC